MSKYFLPRMWVLKFAIFLIVITSIPYLIGFMSSGSDYIFSGFIFGVEDGNSYLAKMLSGSSGSWLFYTPYTAYPQSGVVAFLPYILLGKLAAGRGMHEQLLSLFHIFRWISIFIYCLASYDFISLFIPDEKLRRIGVLLISLGGGLGWLMALGGGALWQNAIPLEFYSPETFGFLEIMGLPHLACARGFLLWGLLCYLKSYDGNNKNCSIIISALSWTLLSVMQPLTVVVGWFLISSHFSLDVLYNLIIRKANINKVFSDFIVRFKRLIGIILLSSPLIIYTAMKFLGDPFLKVWSSQNIISSPPFTHYLLTYGLLMPFALFEFIKSIRTWSNITIFNSIWFALFPVLAYAPTLIQRRLPEGVWTALVILFLSAVALLKKKKLIINVIVPLSLISTAFFLIGSVFSISKLTYPLFIPKETARIFLTLNSLIQQNEVILASYSTGNVLPAWVPARVLVGHGPESAYLQKTMQQVNTFYSTGTIDIDRLKIIKEFNIKYVMIGPEERRIGTWIPENSQNFVPIIIENDWTVYRVNYGN